MAVATTTQDSINNLSVKHCKCCGKPTERTIKQLCQKCYDREYVLAHREQVKNRKRKYLLSHRKQIRKAKAQWQKQNHEKHNAENLAYYHIPLKGHCCEICASNKDIHRCHMDYSKPLEVHFWCRKCHTIIDRTILPNITDPHITALLLGVDQ